MKNINKLSKYFWQYNKESELFNDKISNNNFNIHYYLDLSKKIGDKESFTLFDDDGIPLKYIKGIGNVYNPTRICGYGLGCLELFLKTNEIRYKENFVKQAEWLVRNVESVNNKFYGWLYKFPGPFRLKPPWISGMAQGEGISLLLRAYELTKDSKYLSVAEKAFPSFNYDISERGVKYISEDHLLFFEEIPSIPPMHILNGFIFALFGIFDYYCITKDELALKLFNEGITTLEKYLPIYDLGFWSRYDLLKKGFPNVASIFYHTVHIAQLKALYKITGNEIFRKYIFLWEECLFDIRKRILALTLKIIHKIFYY